MIDEKFYRHAIDLIVADRLRRIDEKPDHRLTPLRRNVVNQLKEWSVPDFGARIEYLKQEVKDNKGPWHKHHDPKKMRFQEANDERALLQEMVLEFIAAARLAHMPSLIGFPGVPENVMAYVTRLVEKDTQPT